MFSDEMIVKKGQNDLFSFDDEHRAMLPSIHHRRYEVLRKHLRGTRRTAGLTQAELGTRMKVDQSYISKIERGERYVDVLLYLDWCRACKMLPEALLADLIRAGA